MKNKITKGYAVPAKTKSRVTGNDFQAKFSCNPKTTGHMYEPKARRVKFSVPRSSFVVVKGLTVFHVIQT